MKLIFSSILSISFAISAFAQSSFEGKLELTARNPEKNETAEIEWFIKDGNHRFDYSVVADEVSGNYSLIAANGSVKMVSPGIEQPVDVPQSSLQKENFDLSNAYVTQESEGHKVFGFACKKMVVQGSDYLVEYWLCDNTGLSREDFPSFMQKGLMTPLAEESEQAVPVKIQVKDLNGKLVYSHTISEVEATEVNDSLFQW